MAIDTAAKRASAINVGSPWRGILPIPDSTIDQGDRQTVTFMYSGILAAEAAQAVPSFPDSATPIRSGVARVSITKAGPASSGIQKR